MKEEVFIESAVRDATISIRDYYRGEGFADVAIKEPVFTFNKARTRVTITIIIEEGPKYRITDVKLSGEIIPELAPELARIKKEIIGQPYFVRQKLFLRTKLEDAHDVRGYADAKVVVEAVRLAEPLL